MYVTDTQPTHIRPAFLWTEFMHDGFLCIDSMCAAARVRTKATRAVQHGTFGLVKQMKMCVARRKRIPHGEYKTRDSSLKRNALRAQCLRGAGRRVYYKFPGATLQLLRMAWATAETTPFFMDHILGRPVAAVHTLTTHIWQTHIGGDAPIEAHNPSLIHRSPCNI